MKKMRICFELSGEHETLPCAEVQAVLRAESIPYRKILEQSRMLIVAIETGDMHRLGAVAERLSMTRYVHEVITISKKEKQAILASISNSDLLPFIEKGQTYKVRTKQIENTANSHNSGKQKVVHLPESLEAKIGGIIHTQGFSADLGHPDVYFKLLLARESAVFVKTLHTINRGYFEERKPQNKPFFYPGVLMPRISRALVNLCELTQEHVLLDPFCGTSGILVEAGLMKIEVIGSDIQRKIILGAKMNLEHYLRNYTLMYQDAAQLALKDETIDAVITDPPYGRSAIIKSKTREKLLDDSLQEIHRVLKKGKKSAIIYDRPLDTLLNSTGFTITEYHRQRVHKSLTRHIYIIKK